MIVIVGLVVLLVAVIVGFTGVLTNAGPAHPLTENFSLFGYHVTGSTGTLFLSGIVVGAVAMLGLSVLLAGARRTAGRGRDARHERSRRRPRATGFPCSVASRAVDNRRAPRMLPDAGRHRPHRRFCQPAVAACHHRKRRTPQ
jgi:hypothetical protein